MQVPVSRFCAAWIAAGALVVAACSSNSGSVAPNLPASGPGAGTSPQSLVRSSPPQSLVRSSHFTHLMTIQNVRRGDPLAQPYTSEGSSYTPQHVSFPNAFTSVENRATSPHYKAILAAFSHSGANSNRTKPLAVVGSDDSGGQAGIIINATTGTGQTTFRKTEMARSGTRILTTSKTTSISRHLQTVTETICTLRRHTDLMETAWKV